MISSSNILKLLEYLKYPCLAKYEQLLYDKAQRDVFSKKEGEILREDVKVIALVTLGGMGLFDLEPHKIFEKIHPQLEEISARTIEILNQYPAGKLKFKKSSEDYLPFPSAYIQDPLTNACMTLVYGSSFVSSEIGLYLLCAFDVIKPTENNEEIENGQVNNQETQVTP